MKEELYCPIPPPYSSNWCVLADAWLETKSDVKNGESQAGLSPGVYTQ